MALTDKDFSALADRFQKSSDVLFKTGQYETARYLRGFSIESSLKSKICKNIIAGQFPDQNVKQTHYIHSLPKLLETAQLKAAFDFDASTNSNLQESFQIIKDWDPDLRYDATQVAKKTAQDFFDACKEFESWLAKN